MKLKEYDLNKDITIIFMSGYGNNDKEEKRFEWEASSKGFDANRIFVQDVVRAWYHDSFEHLIPILKEKCKDKKVLAVGASMGGYAALIVAHELNGSSIAFAPQTNIKIDFLEANDRRWLHNCGAANKITRHPQYLDICFIEGEQHHIYYSKDFSADVMHAERLKVKHFPQDCLEHNVAGFLKSKGMLAGIIKDRLEEIKNGKTN